MALAWSLNIPALEVLRSVGINEFQQNMRMMDVDLLKPPMGDPGLSLAIGTCGVRLLDLANAYATLARQGEWIPWKVITGENGSAPRRIVGAPASYLVLQALADPVLRPPEAIDPTFLNLRGVAWKTGTSNGYRDAWCFAVTRDYTVGIWLGNMNGKASRALVGARAAAPVALSVIKRIQRKIDPTWPVRPEGGWMNATICSETGLIANKDCPTTEVVPILSPVNPTQVCSVHRRVEIDVVTSRSLCTRCQEGHNRISEVCSVYPGRVTAWLRQNPQIRTAPLPPEHFPGCITVAKGAPIIVSPLPNSEFIVTDELPADFQKLSLEAQSPAPGTKLFWFIDGGLVGSGDSDSPVTIKPASGTHLVKVVDEFGRWDSVRFSVSKDGRAGMLKHAPIFAEQM
jgi:penicillin-binding protein 1C